MFRLAGQSLVIALATLVLSPRGHAADRLAVFDCREITGRDRTCTLMTYPLALAAGQAAPGAVKLVDAAGAERPCQLSARHLDGDHAQQGDQA